MGKRINLFLTGQFLINFGYFFYQLLLNLHLMDLGLPFAVAAKTVAIFNLTQALVLIPAGFLGDRVERGYLVSLSALASGLSFLFLTFMKTPGEIYFLAALAGIFYMVFFTNTAPAIWESFEDSGEKVLAHYFFLSFVAAMLGNFIAGFSGAFLGNVWSLSIASVCIFLGGLFLPIKTRKKKEAKHLVEIKLEKKPFLLVMGFAFFLALGGSLIMPYLNLFFRNNYHVSLKQIGFVYALAEGVAAFGIKWGYFLANKIGLKFTILLLTIFSLPFSLGLTLKLTVIWAYGLFLGRHFFINGATSLLTVYILKKAPESLRGAVNSILLTIYNFSSALAGGLGVFLEKNYGFTGLFFGGALFQTIAMVIFLREVNRNSN